MTQIRPVSDIHLEFSEYELPQLDTDKDTVLLLAGDIGIADNPARIITFLKLHSPRFKQIIYIFGNHEFWKGSMIRARQKLKALVDTMIENHNIRIVENEIIEIDDVSYICTTLWTDMNNLNPVLLWDAEQRMVDYRQIRTGNFKSPYLSKLKPLDTVREFNMSKLFIFESIRELRELDENKKIVVVTHHGCSYQSVALEHKSSNINGAFVTELTDDIITHKPNLWVHGHVHSSNDYMIGDTRVVTNPRGYIAEPGHRVYDEPNYDFKPELVIEL